MFFSRSESYFCVIKIKWHIKPVIKTAVSLPGILLCNKIAWYHLISLFHQVFVTPPLLSCSLALKCYHFCQEGWRGAKNAQIVAVVKKLIHYFLSLGLGQPGSAPDVDK